MTPTLLERERRLHAIGIALSTEHERTPLLTKILEGAKELCEADGGTLYTVTSEQRLHFECILSDTLDFSEAKLPDFPLFTEEGKPIQNFVVTHAVHAREPVHIPDVYQAKGYDFSGTFAVDELLGYHTREVLVVPVIDYEGNVACVLQLINPKTPFNQEDIDLTRSLASQAGIALTNQRLICDLEALFNTLIRTVGSAIDEKSPATANHSRRVPVLARLLAEAVGGFTEEQLHELEVAAYLHDIGKIATPEHIMDKRTKLETVFDRIELLKTRLEVLKREQPERTAEFDAYAKLFDECNRGEIPITDDVIKQIEAASCETWGEGRPLLTDEEKASLLIPHGNLNPEERKIIDDHILATQRILAMLPFPKNLSEVPEIAGAHHEHIDGTGYPQGLTGDQMSVRARILPIADIFEALSSPERLYKKALTLPEITRIMDRMAADGHIDPQLWETFKRRNVGQVYLELIK